jgi:hypothetical protein
MTQDERTIDPTDEPATADARPMPGAPDASRDPVGRPGDRDATDAAPTPPGISARQPANRSETQDPSQALDEPRREDETTEPG